MKMLFAFAFSLFGSFLFIKILDRIRFKDAVFIPLVGLMLGGVVSAISTFMAYQYDLIQNVNAWFEGDFSLIMKGRYELLYVSIPLVIIAYLFANKFTVAGMGESFSVNLGLNYKRVINKPDHCIGHLIGRNFDGRHASFSRADHSKHCLDLSRGPFEKQPASHGGSRRRLCPAV